MIFPEEGGVVYKDLSLLSENRLYNLEKESEDDDEPEMSEIIVIDIQDSEKCCDTQIVTYM